MCPTTRDAHWLGWHKVSMSSRHRSRLPVWCSPSRRVADIQCPWSVSHVVGLWSRYPWRLHAVALVWLARAVYHHEMGHQGRWTSTLFNGCHQTPRNTKGVRLPVPMFYSHTDNGLKTPPVSGYVAFCMQAHPLWEGRLQYAEPYLPYALAPLSFWW